jgi:hypothetical protein
MHRRSISQWGLLLGAALTLGAVGCNDARSRDDVVQSHQTTTEVHEAKDTEPGTGGSGGSGTGCSHDPDSANPCNDAFLELPRSLGLEPSPRR